MTSLPHIWTTSTNPSLQLHQRAIMGLRCACFPQVVRTMVTSEVPTDHPRHLIINKTSRTRHREFPTRALNATSTLAHSPRCPCYHTTCVVSFGFSLDAFQDPGQCLGGLSKNECLQMDTKYFMISSYALPPLRSQPHRLCAQWTIERDRVLTGARAIIGPAKQQSTRVDSTRFLARFRHPVRLPV